MIEITFEVPGEPASWHVFTRYDDSLSKAKLKSYQDDIRFRARVAFQGREPHAGPVELELWFYLSQYIPKRGKPKEVWEKKPDRTNFQKGAEDALNGIAYLDDQQVIGGPTYKFYSDNPRTVITVRLLEPEDLSQIQEREL